MSAIPTKVVNQIKTRDHDMCAFCGIGRATDSHHRMRRRDGEHSPANLIRLCHDCHMWLHAHPKAAYAVGYIIPALRRPALEPQQVPLRLASGVWVLLPEDGGPYIALAPEVAVARLVRWDMREAA